MNYEITIGEDTYDIDAPDEATLRKAVNKLRLQVGTARSVEAAEAGAESRSREWNPDADPYGMGIIPGMDQQERDAAMFEGYGQGARESAPLAASAAMLPISSAAGARMLPFLARLGAGNRIAGAGQGAARALPFAAPQLLEGNLRGAAKTVAAGAAMGFAAPGWYRAGPVGAASPVAAAPAAAPAAPAVAAGPAAAAAAPTMAAPAIRQLMQIAKESGAKAGQKVWFLLENGQPVKILTPAAAAAASRAGQATTWVKAF